MKSNYIACILLLGIPGSYQPFQKVKIINDETKTIKKLIMFVLQIEGIVKNTLLMTSRPKEVI